MTEAESYRSAQDSGARITDIKSEPNELSDLIQAFEKQGLDTNEAKRFVELKLAGNKREARRLIRESIAESEKRERLGLKEEGAFDREKGMELLRSLRSSRRKKERRKRHGKRK